jgi:hypothetical protein
MQIMDSQGPMYTEKRARVHNPGETPCYLHNARSFLYLQKIFHQKRKIMRKAITVFSLLLMSTALLFGAGVQETNQSGLEYVMNKGELILGLDDSFPRWDSETRMERSPVSI